MGQEFVKAANVSAWIAEMVLTGAAKVFSSSAHVDIYARLPYFMNPVLAACQVRRPRRAWLPLRCTEAVRARAKRSFGWVHDQTPAGTVAS